MHHALPASACCRACTAACHKGIAHHNAGPAHLNRQNLMRAAVNTYATTLQGLEAAL